MTELSRRWWRCGPETYFNIVMAPVNPHRLFDGWIVRGEPGDIGVFVAFDGVMWLDETGPVPLLDIYCSVPPAGSWTPIEEGTPS